MERERFLLKRCRTWREVSHRYGSYQDTHNSVARRFLYISSGLLSLPFLALLVKSSETNALLLVTHYQSLVLAVLGLSIAVIALTTYLGLEDRVRQALTREISAMKADNKLRVRLLLDLEKSRVEPVKFQEVTERILTDTILYEFFREDLREVFLAYIKPGQITAATALALRDFFRKHPQYEIDSVWKFFIDIATQSEQGFHDAKHGIPLVLQKISTKQIFLTLIWFFDLWDSTRDANWRRALSDFLLEASNQWNFRETVIPTIQQRCEQVYDRNHETNWSATTGAVGQLTLYVRHLDTSNLERLTLYYADLFGVQAISNEEMRDQTNRAITTRGFIIDDLQRCADSTYLQSLEDKKNEVRVMVAYLDKLIHERESMYGLIVVSRHGPSIIPNLCEEHTLQAFTRNLESDHNMKILWVAKDPDNTAENEKICDFW